MTYLELRKKGTKDRYVVLTTLGDGLLCMQKETKELIIINSWHNQFSGYKVVKYERD